LIAPNIAPKVTEPASDWRVANWPAAVRDALGRAALLKFRLTFTLVLTPSFALAAYALWSQRPTLLIWVLLAVWGFGTASAGPTGIGMLASLLVAVAGAVVGAMEQDWLYVMLGLLPGCTWFASCALLGVTASYLLDALRSTPELADSLCRRGILIPAAPMGHQEQ
jgi:hypothetical protein